MNGEDAANNDTSIPIHFINKQWYRVRLRVVNEVIQVFMDDKRIVDVNTKGIKLSVRPEVELSRPLGLSSFATRSAYRKIVLRRL
ncbi:MAG: hypothetical protein HRT88_20305 [Lentisphaeraceae bacterium]|nr:hypothetical protein [Lentisphaeraceae bacterium]